MLCKGVLGSQKWFSWRPDSHMCGRVFMPGVWCISVHLFNCKFLPEFAPERDPNTHRTLSIWTVATPDICESGFIESRSHSHMCEPSLREHILAPIDHVQYYAFKISKFPPPLFLLNAVCIFTIIHTEHIVGSTRYS